MPSTLTAVHAAGAWLVILVLAILNGGFRQAVLIPRLGVAAGTALSGGLLIAAVIFVTWGLLRWRRTKDAGHAWRVGTGWFAATLVFEFGFGRLVQGKSWSALLSAYTFEDGNLWPLVLIALLVSPYAFTARRRRPDHLATR
jgi:hypothetical protein